jgi:signal transduction histidine kinase
LLCSTGELSEEQADYARTIRESGKLLLTIVSDVLDYSRLEAGQLVLHAVPFSPGMVVHHVAALIAELAREKRIDVRCEGGEGLPQLLIGDPERVKQMLLNIASNGVKVRGYVRAMNLLIRVSRGPLLTLRVGAPRHGCCAWSCAVLEG